MLKCLIFIIMTPRFLSKLKVLTKDLALLLDLFGNSEETKLLICTAIFVWCLQRQRNGGLNSGLKSAIIVTDALLIKGWYNHDFLVHVPCWLTTSPYSTSIGSLSFPRHHILWNLKSVNQPICGFYDLHKQNIMHTHTHPVTDKLPDN